MEANNLPPAQTGANNSPPPQATPNAPVSSYSPATKVYPIESLEVHQRGQVAPQVTSAPTQASVPFSRRRAVVVSLIITLIVLFITGFAIAFFVRRSTETSQLGVPTQDVALESIGSDLPPELEGAGDALFVNGDLITGGELKVFSGSFASSLAAQTLTENQTITLPNASGSLCLDSNNCNFATQDQLAQDTTLIDQQAAELTALQAQVDAIAPAVGVTSLNGQAGAVTIQGTGVNISDGGGAVNLSVAYGAAANTAVQGNTTLICASGTGNLTGGGNPITLGAGGICGGLNTVANPTFGTSVTIGTAAASNGALILQNATNAFGVTLNAPNQTTGNATVSLPDTAGANDTVCLQTLANCGGGGGGITSINGQAGPAITISNATGAGNAITIDDAVADGATKGIAAFNSTNFTAAAGVINTIQDIATTSDVTFNSLGLTDTLNVGGNSTLGDAAGDTLTINGTNVFIPNSLAFDTNVMFIDAGTNRVGIGDNSPAYALTVGSGDLFGVDSSGNVIVTALGAADTDNVICRNSSNILSTCNSTFATTTDLDGYVQLQSTTPGTQQTGHLNVSGTGIFGTSVQTPLVDTPSAAALNIGTTNATQINLNQSTNIDGNLTITSEASGSRVITGRFNDDFSGTGATTYFQNSDTDGSTYLNLLANGTATTTGIMLHDNTLGSGQFGVIEHDSTTENLNIRATNNLSNAGSTINLITKPGGGGSETTRLSIDPNGLTTFNPTGTDSDFIIQGDTNTSLFYVDAGTDRVGIGDATPAYLLTVGNGDLFGVNNSGAIAAATGINSSGTITFSGLTNCASVQTDGSGVLSCGGGGSTTLQSAYDSGNTITTSDARDIAITLADTTTDSNLLVDIATGSTGRFAVQGNGTDVLGVTSTAITSTIPILGQDGAVGAPAYSFDSDPDTGAYLPVADQLGFSAGGTNLLTVGGTDVNLQIPTSNARAEIYGVSGTNQEFDIVSDGSVIVTIDEDGDSGSASFGVYEETSEIFSIANDGFVTTHGGIFIEEWLDLGVHSFTPAGDETLTPLSSYVEVNCSNGAGCTLTMDDTTSTHGQTVFIVNIGTNPVNFDNTPGVQQLSANPVALGQYDTLTLIYSSDRWIQYATSDNL